MSSSSEEDEQIRSSGVAVRQLQDARESRPAARAPRVFGPENRPGGRPAPMLRIIGMERELGPLLALGKTQADYRKLIAALRVG